MANELAATVWLVINALVVLIFTTEWWEGSLVPEDWKGGLLMGFFIINGIYQCWRALKALGREEQ